MASGNLPMVGGHPEGFASTLRDDRWWIGPLVTLVGFTSFVVYSTWAAFQGDHYWFSGEATSGYGGYLSPFYSPVFWTPDGATLAAGMAPSP